MKNLFYYLYHLVRSDDGVKERLIYKNEDNQYVEYIHGKNITSTENYVERMNEVRSVIKKYALYDIQIVNSEGNTYVFDTKKQILKLNINDDYHLSTDISEEINKGWYFK